MKVLLVGDYSMVHKNLKDGLESLGCKVVLTSNGDGWKKLPGADFPMTVRLRTLAHSRIIWAAFHIIDIFVELLFVFLFYKYLCAKNHFDVIHMMSADLFDYRNRKRIYRFFFRLSHNRLYVSIPGDDCYTYEAWGKGCFKYACFDDYPEMIRRFGGQSKASKIENDAYKYTVKHAKGLIPLNPYETEMPYRGFPNLRRYIPLPINVTPLNYTDNLVNRKIVIFHGVGYSKKKGSEYILEAMRIIGDKYGDCVQIVTGYRDPYEVFINKMSRCNIYVDQCKSYSYGMSAIIAMAMGKIVLSGLEEEVLSSVKTPGCPVYNIVPNTNQIVEVLENIIASRQEFVEFGRRGRRYVEAEHDYVKVAGMYLEEWSK